MERISNSLTLYLVNSDIINREDFEIYKYGFLSGFELLLYITINLFIAVYNQWIPELILFFGIFMPIRSYSGGIHLKHYSTCLVLSVLIFVGVVLFSTNNPYAILHAFIGTIILIIAIIYQNSKRPLDSDYWYYMKCLKIVSGIVMFIVVVLLILENHIFMSLIANTMIIIFISVLLETHSNKLRNKEKSK